MPFAYNGTLMEKKKRRVSCLMVLTSKKIVRGTQTFLIISGNKKEKNEHGVLSKFGPMHSLSEIIYDDSRYRITD